MLHLLSQLSELGITLSLDCDRLKVNAPQGTLTPKLKEVLLAHKQDLIDRLRQNRASETEFSWPAVEIDLAGRNEPFPMTDVQYAYWMGRSSGLELGGVSTHFYFELECMGVDIPRLEESWRRVIERHEMLRAVFDADGRQRILASVPPYVIKVTDLREAAESERCIRVAQLRERMSHQVLPADRWPLFEIQSVRLSQEITRLHISLDMLILDGWSISQVFKEWYELYYSPEQVLPEFRLSFRDYVLSQAAVKDSQWYRAAQDYWWARLDSLPPAPLLPVARVEPGRRYEFGRRHNRLSGSLWTSIKEKAKALGITPSGILMAAFSEVLTLWSKKPHFTLNLTLFNRWPLHEEVNRIAGDFTSLSLLEVDYSKRAPFRERAVKLQEQFLRDLQYRVVSGVEVMREWSKRQGAQLQAAMPVVFTSGVAFGSPDGDETVFVERFGPMVYGVSQTPQVWLDHQAMEEKGDLLTYWDAAEELFAPEILNDMFSAYTELLVKLAKSPNVWDLPTPLSLPPVQYAQRQALNHTCCETEDALLHGLFIRQALRDPEALAIVSGENRILYGQLLSAASRLAHDLQRQGDGQVAPVAVVMEKGWEQIVAVLGILMSGRAYVPIDPDLPAERRQQLFRQCGAIHAVTQPILQDVIEWPDGVGLFIIDWDGQGEDIRPPLSSQSSSDLAYVIFTSGSTGVPKGVMIDHRGAVNTILHINSLFQVNSSDKVLAVSSLGFDLSVYDIFGILAAGGCVVIPEARLSKEPQHWHELLIREEISLWNSAPPLMRMLMDFSESAGEGREIPLRLALLSGDWIPVSLPDRVKCLSPHAEVISLGGATEVSIWSIYYPIGAVGVDWKSIPYGKPLPNQTIHVLNELKQPCPEAVVGHIHIGGIGLAMGYLNDPDLTARKFILHPDTGERLYDTGDLGRYLPDGNIEFLGREDSQVKVRGHRIELGEIAAVLRSHPAVDEAMAIAEGDSRTDVSLWAYIKCNPEHRELLIKRLATDPVECLMNWNTVLQSVKEQALKSPAAPVSCGFKDLCVVLDTFYVHAVIAALRSLGAFVQPEALDATSLRMRTGIVERYHRWVARALEEIKKRGLLDAVEGNMYRASSPLPVIDLVPLADDVASQLMQAADFTQAEAHWQTHIALILPDLLTERKHSAEIYTAKEAPSFFQRMFPDSHIQLARAVRALANIHPGAELQVLEVRAGLGSATTHVLPVLASSPCTYHFTDISEFFVRAAQDKFCEFSFVSYHLFNAENDPSLQGYDLHSYDLIIADSVLHDVRDIQSTMRNLLSLLAPGGTLMFLEETRFIPSFDLHMGLQRDFDNFVDGGGRRNHPLLSREQWTELLADVGFQRISVLTEPGTTADFIGFDLLVAQGPAEVESFNEAILDEHLARHLPAHARPTRYLILPDFPLSSNGKLDHKALPRPARRKQAAQEKMQPRNAVESALQSIWQEVLGLESVGVLDNFFELGGDSLVAAELMRRIYEEISVQVPLYDLFGTPTIEGLAVVVENLLASGNAMIDAEMLDEVQEPEEVFPALKMDATELTREIIEIPVLDDTVKCISNLAARKGGSDNVLLIGATGFLGAYVLRDLLTQTDAEVYCLVRAESAVKARVRIREYLERFGILDESHFHRVVPVAGDITHPKLGLSRDVWNELTACVGLIYHLAGEVNLVRSFQDLRQGYIEAIRGILEFAALNRIKPVLFCSSVATCMRYVPGQGMVVYKKEAPIESPEGLPTGYAQCKWVVEQTLAAANQAGIPTAVFRPSHILADSCTGASSGWDMFGGLLSLCSSVGVLPEWNGAVMDGVPVDMVSRLMVAAGSRPESFGKTFNLVHDQPTPMLNILKQLLAMKGSQVEVCSAEEWKRLCAVFLESSAPIEVKAVFLRFFSRITVGEMIDYFFLDHRYSSNHTTQLMEDAHLRWPKLDEAYWQRYFTNQKIFN